MSDYVSRFVRSILQAMVPAVAAIGADLAGDGEINKQGMLIALGLALGAMSSGLMNLAEYIKEKYAHSS